MKIKHLPILSLLCIPFCSLGQINANAAATELLAGNTRAEATPFSLNNSTPALPWSGDGGNSGGVQLCINLGLASGTLSAQYGNIKTSGSGFDYMAGLGASFQKEGAADGHMRIISVMLNVTTIKAKLNYTDSKGAAATNDFTIGYARIPVTYTSILAGQSGVGFYYQGGMNFDYNANADDGGKNVAPNFNKIILTPGASVGISFPITPPNGNKKELVLIGPYVTYSLNNLSSLDNTTISRMTFGISFYVTNLAE